MNWYLYNPKLAELIPYSKMIQSLYSYITLAFLMLSFQSVFSQKTPLQKADWITISYPEAPVKRACPVFQRQFKAGNNIRKAVLCITTLGLYQACLNGKRIGEAYFTPGFTSYTKRLQYQAYDVTGMLGKDNTLQVTVGEGWYRGVFRSFESDSLGNNYGSKAGLLAELEITYADGLIEKIGTDGSWLCRESKTRYSELYEGELFDAGFVEKPWQPVKLLDYTKSILIPSAAEQVKKQEVFKPVRVFKTPKGEQVIDFGQNLAGWVELKVKGRAGDTVRLAHAEVLDSLGNFYTGNLRNAKATDTYVLSGKGTEVFEPHFTYHGFRYVKLTGADMKNVSLSAVALYSDLKKTGTFSCSDPMVNQLQRNIEWSLNSNFFDIPTDCPQRSERLGWTRDAQVFAPTASFLRNTKNFYSKWLEDLAAEQRESGAVPVFIPTSSPLDVAVGGVAGWGDAATIIPWNVYEVYNDVSVLARQFPSMKGWVEYIRGKAVDGLWKARGYGDWYAMGDSTSLHFIDQCYYAHSTELLLKTARVLGKADDVKMYSALLDQVKKAFIAAYGKFDTKATSTQSAYVLALAYDLLPEERRQAVADKLAVAIRANGNKLATGFLGTPHLLPVLSRFGYSDVAYKLLMQKDCPSWLYPVTRGATTIWERWDAIKPDGSIQETSFNHYAYGAVGRWLYENVAGIRSAAPGYEKIILKPEIGGGMSWVKGSYMSGFGKIVSEWRVSGKKVLMKVEIPKGTKATVFIPGRDSVIVAAGKYRFTGLLVDGPYVFYDGTKRVSKGIEAGKVKSAEGLRSVSVELARPAKGFSVRLKDSLMVEPSVYVEPEKIFAVSDVEGEFQGFRKLMMANGVFDEHFNWTFGKGHLVIAGDLFDRGKQVTEYLWLLYRLEEKAKAAGGYVHVILGNHDIMNLSGDLRYVDRKYLLSAESLGMDYMSLFDKNTELGRWLRSKNVMEKIGDKLFVHAGISPELIKLGYGIQQLNDLARPYYDTPKKDLRLSLQTVFGKDGPFWYRGYFMAPRATMQDVDNALRLYGCKQIIVGHTIVNKNITAYYERKIIGIDVDHHAGRHFGILFSAGRWQVADDKGKLSDLVYRPENDVIKEGDIE